MTELTDTPAQRLRNSITKLLEEFRDQTGIMVSQIDVSLVDMGHMCGLEWNIGEISISFHPSKI